MLLSAAQDANRPGPHHSPMAGISAPTAPAESARVGIRPWADEDRDEQAAETAALTWIAFAGWTTLTGLVFLVVVFV